MARLNSRTHLRSDAARKKVRPPPRGGSLARASLGSFSFLPGYNAPRNSPFSMIYVSLTRRDNEKICRLFMTSVQRLTGSFISLPPPPPPPTAFPRTFFFLTRISRIFYFFPRPTDISCILRSIFYIRLNMLSRLLEYK